MAKRKRQQQQRALPERQQLLMQRVEQRRDTPHALPRRTPEKMEIPALMPPPAPLFVQPSLFDGMASAFNLFPTLDDMPFMHLSDEQIEAISQLSDYLALVGDRARVDARFRRALYHALMRLSGEMRAIKRTELKGANQHDEEAQGASADEEHAHGAAVQRSAQRRLKLFFYRLTPSHE